VPAWYQRGAIGELRQWQLAVLVALACLLLLICLIVVSATSCTKTTSRQCL
jgi:branched-subunit amino acid permease